MRIKRLIASTIGSAVLIAGSLVVADPALAQYPSQFNWTSDVATGPGWALDSPNGVYRAIFQTDGNFVVYHGGSPIWSSHTWHNGDAVVFNGPGSVWGSGQVQISFLGSITWGNGVNYAGVAGYHLNMQNDGNFVEYANGGTVLWATNTAGQ